MKMTTQNAKPSPAEAYHNDPGPLLGEEKRHTMTDEELIKEIEKAPWLVDNIENQVEKKEPALSAGPAYNL